MEIPEGLILSRSKGMRYLKSYVLPGKHIGMYGNFGHGDLGDDACFYTARDLIGQELLPVSKRAYVFNPRSYKAFVVGCGGSLRWESPYLPRRLLRKEKWPFPVVLFSAGVNRDFDAVFSEEAINQIKNLCRICDYLSVRDPLTKRFLNELGFEDVHLLPDIELLTRGEPKDFGYTKSGFTVGIAISPHSEFSTSLVEEITGAFARFTDYLTESGMRVVYLPFENGASANTREAGMYTAIAKRLVHPDAATFFKDDITPQQMKYAIGAYCDVCVCMRLHAAVFALGAGVPFLTVSFNDMHRGFLELTDMRDYELTLGKDFSFFELKRGFKRLMQNKDELDKKIGNKRDELAGMIHQEITYIKSVMG